MIICSQPECQTTAGCTCTNRLFDYSRLRGEVAAKEAELSALKKQVEEQTAEMDAATISGWKAAIDCVSYAAANTYGPRVDPAAVAKARDDLVQELLTASPGDYLDCCWKDAQDAIRAEAEAAALRKALEFYADVSKYPAPLTGGMGDLWADCGRIARAALEAAGRRE